MSPDTILALGGALAPVTAIAAKWVVDQRFQRTSTTALADLTSRVHGIDAEVSGLRDDTYVLLSGRLTIAFQKIAALHDAAEKLAAVTAEVSNGKLAAMMAEIRQLHTAVARLEAHFPDSS